MTQFHHVVILYNYHNVLSVSMLEEEASRKLLQFKFFTLFTKFLTKQSLIFTFLIFFVYLSTFAGNLCGQVQQVFTYTNNNQIWTTLACVNSIDIKLCGVGGAESPYNNDYNYGVSKSFVEGTLAVSTEQILYTDVGRGCQLKIGTRTVEFGVGACSSITEKKSDNLGKNVLANISGSYGRNASAHKEGDSEGSGIVVTRCIDPKYTVSSGTGSAIPDTCIEVLISTPKGIKRITSTCATGCSTTKYVTPNPTSLGGIVSSDQIICSGSQPDNITLSDHTGTIQWQVSTDNFYWSDISGATTSTLSSTQMGTLTATRYYRAAVTSGVCGVAYSTVVTVTVNPFSVGPLETSVTSTGICEGTIVSLMVNDKVGKGGEINHSAWAVGSGNATGFIKKGEIEENVRIISTDPWGNNVVVWEARTDGGNDGSGGWCTNKFPIDNTKLYRYSVWVKRSVIGNGTTDFGVYGYSDDIITGVIPVTGTASYVKSYFWVGDWTYQPNEWVLHVGYIYPHNYSGGNNVDRGLWSVTGVHNTVGTDFKWLSTTTHAAQRTYLYYSTDLSTRQQFLYPRVDIIDGSEPSIQDLLNGFDAGHRDGLSAGASWKWYKDDCGSGTAVGTGDSISVSPTATTSYFVRAEGGSCPSTTACKEVTVIINPKTPDPIITAGDATTFCIGDNVQLTASTVNMSGNAMQFNGTPGIANSGGYINIGNVPSMKITGNQTIEMWIKPYGFSHRQNPYNKSYGGEGTITLEPAGNLNYYYGTNGSDGGDYQEFTSGAILFNAWSHIAIVRDFTNNKLTWYINGIQSTQTTLTYTAAVASNQPLKIGTGFAGGFNGEIDEVRVWNVARTQAQIQANKDIPIQAGVTGLAGYWRFDEASGNNVYDASGYNNTGVMTSLPTRVIPSTAPMNVPASSYSWSPTTGLLPSTGLVVTASPISNQNYTLTIQNPLDCANGTNSQQIIVNHPSTAGLTLAANDYFWYGKSGTDWGTDANWLKYNGSSFETTSIPTSTSNVVISNISGDCNSANQPLVSLANGVCNNLFIASGATVSMSNNQNLDIKGNWTNTGTFDASNGTVTFNGTSPQNIESGGSAFNNVNFDNSAGFNVNEAMTINGEADFNSGIVNFMTADSLTFGNSATSNIGNANSFVNGVITKTGTSGFNFATGDGVYWGPCGIAATSASSTITAQYVHSAGPANYHPNFMCSGSGLHHTSGVEHWLLTSNESTPAVTLYWNDDSGVVNSDELVVAHYDEANYCWNNKGGSVSGNSVTSTIPFNGYSPISLGTLSSINPLPVELLSFTAECNNNSEVLLSWTTASEINNDYFEIQRSTQALSWEVITRVLGAGYSSSLLNYSYLDKDKPNTTIYYRLRQVDYDGTDKFSDIIQIRCENVMEKPIITVYPNPFNDNLNVEFENWDLNTAEIELLDITGRLIQNWKLEKTKSNFVEELRLDKLVPAMYMLQFKTSDGILIKKIEKK